MPYGARAAGATAACLDRTLHYPRFAARVGRGGGASWCARARSDVVDAQGLTALGYGAAARARPDAARAAGDEPAGHGGAQGARPEAARPHAAARAVARSGAPRRSRGRHGRGHARATCRASSACARRGWWCCPTASTSTRSRRSRRPTRGRVVARRAARRCAGRVPSSCPWAASRPTRASTTCSPALAALHARRRAARGAGPGWSSARARGTALRAARLARPARARTCRFAGRVDGGAAARALRARRRVRARHALRGLEPGHAGGDGPRPARGGHARGRHPRQGDGRRERAPGRRRATWPAWPRASQAPGATPRAARAHGRARAAARARARFSSAVLVDRTLALYERAAGASARVTPRVVAALAALRRPRRAGLVIVTGAGGASGGGPVPRRARGRLARRCVRCCRPRRARPARGRGRAARCCSSRPSCSSTPAAGASTATASCTTSTSAPWQGRRPRLHQRVRALRLLDREDIAVPTRTGLRRSIFAVGPALVWTALLRRRRAWSRAAGCAGPATSISPATARIT